MLYNFIIHSGKGSEHIARVGQGTYYRRTWRNLRVGGVILFLDCFVDYLAIHLSKLPNYMLTTIDFFFIYKSYFYFIQMQKDKNENNYFSYLMKAISKPDQCIFWVLESPRPKHRNKRKHLSHGGNVRTKSHRLI